MSTVAIPACSEIQASDLADPLDGFGAANARGKQNLPHHLAIIGPDRSVIRAE